MKIIVFGATGTVGVHVVEQALAAGYEVTAFVRNRSKLKITHANLSLAEGDVLDPAAVERAMPGHEAVLITLGAGLKGVVRTEGTRNIEQAMQKSGVKRLICQSSLGVGDSNGNLNFFWKYLMFGLLLRKAFADHVTQEQIVKQSPLDWTIVRPAAFTDDKQTGNYQHGFAGDSPKGLTLKIGRADIAQFLLQQLTSSRYLRKTPGLSY